MSLFTFRGDLLFLNSSVPDIRVACLEKWKVKEMQQILLDGDIRVLNPKTKPRV